jgi:hypothetical protein
MARPLNTRYSGTALIFFILASLVLCHCSKEKTDRDLILEMVGSVQDFVENKYLTAIMDLLTDDFEDMENRDRDDIEKLLGEYFERYQGIVVHVLGSKILRLEGGEAEMETEVSLSSGAAKIFRKLVRYSGQTYRFTLSLVKTESGWRVTYAQWRYITLDELFPESFELLKEIFPDL